MRTAVAKRAVGRPRKVHTEAGRPPWESPAITSQLAEILAALEVSAIDAESRGVFQRALYRQKFVGGDARGQVVMTCRCILESAGNEDAFIGPVVRAVYLAMTQQMMDHGLALIEAFDRIDLMSILRAMVDLKVFTEGEFREFYPRAILNRLRAILEPAAPVKPSTDKPAPKPPARVAKIPAIEKHIQLGRELLALRMQHPSNQRYGAAVRRRFDVDTQHGVECARAARVYGDRPEIYGRLSWDALLTLCTAPAPVRKELERRIIAGERIGAPQIRRARGPLPTGRPKRQPNRSVERMAA